MFVAASKHMCVCVVGWGYACLCTWVLWCWYKNALSCQVLSGLLHHLMIFAGLWQMPNVSAFIIMDTYTCPPAFFACPSWDESFLLSFHWCWFSKTNWLGFSWNLCFCLVNWPQALHTESVRFKSYGYSALLSLRTTDLQLDKILSETPKDIAQIVPVTPSGDPISIPWPAISLNLLDVLTVAKGNLVVTTDHDCVHHCCCTLW